MAKKYSPLFLLFFVLLFIIIDRVLWASVSQWREDQATNIWLGYTQGLSNLRVGLISSYGIPNPNGMLLLGFFLSRLPNLWIISTFLGCLQATLILWLCWSYFGQSRKLFWLTSALLLSSVILRASSVEFWNQWIMTLFNLSFLIWIVLYIRGPSITKLPFLIALICLAPAIYLAGIVNAIVMGLLGTAAIFLKPPERPKAGWWRPVTLCLIVIAISIGLTWIPYFTSVDLALFTHLKSGEPTPLVQKVSLMGEALWRFPSYGIFQWARDPAFAVLQNNPQILGPATVQMVRLMLMIHWIQAVLAFGAILFAVILHWLKARNFSRILDETDQSSALLVAFSAAFIVLSYGLSPLLGGPMWSRNERPDQVIQFFPFFLFFWFLTPFVFRLPEIVRRVVIGLTWTLGALYVVINLAAGVGMINAHLSYRGDVLSNADVPLITKMELVDFIAKDWKSISSQIEIPVDYDLGGGVWDWVPEFGQGLEKWYPASMTMGRSFDYELLRKYGLRNWQEGVQLRPYGKGRYLINYAFQPVPNVTGTSIRPYIFGRLRVTIVER